MCKFDWSLGFIFILSLSKSLILLYLINLTFDLTGIPTSFLTSLKSVLNTVDKIYFKTRTQILLLSSHSLLIIPQLTFEQK